MHEGITYSCEHCDYKAKWKGDFLQYVQSMHEGVTYTCDHCDHKAKWKSDLLRHVQSVHEGITYSCEHCDHKAKQKSEFSDIRDLSMKELLIVVSIIMKQITKVILDSI